MLEFFFISCCDHQQHLFFFFFILSEICITFMIFSLLWTNTQIVTILLTIVTLNVTLVKLSTTTSSSICNTTSLVALVWSSLIRHVFFILVSSTSRIVVATSTSVEPLSFAFGFFC